MKRELIEQRDEQSKLPLFVTVYDTIYDWLHTGKYLPGDKLPGENVLAEQLNVSRGTLRQAMLLLQEDGLIINHQGKGSFVLSTTRVIQSGIEKLNNPMLEYCNQTIDEIHADVLFQAATEKHRETLSLPGTALVAVLDIYYHSNGRTVGLSMVFMAYELLAKNQVLVEDSNAVYRFYNDFLETPGLTANSQIRLTYARQSTADKMGIAENDPMMMLEETIYADSEPVLTQKLFLLPEYYELSLRRKNDRYPIK